MQSIRDILLMGFLFLSLYFEIFMLITYLERRKTLRAPRHEPAAAHPELPGVTIIVPCFNEEKTVAKTLDSLLRLDYPRGKLHIIVVDDGSTDNTQGVCASYSHHPQLTVVRKENGGKHSALNLGIRQAGTEFVGCLDADSYAKPDALIRLVKRFRDPRIMAVVPSLHIHAPRTLIERMQNVEYLIGIFLRSTLAELNALYVTPGPFSIFRKSVYEKIGYYRKAHNTEDMEMALRMQSHGLAIASAHDAVVYTSAPRSVRSLYKQRVRWTSGFLNNLRDYRHMMFRRKYGHIGGFVLPMALLTMFTTFFVVCFFAYDLGSSVHSWYMSYSAIGLRMFSFSWPSVNWFYIRSTPMAVSGICALMILLSLIYIGSRLSAGNRARPVEIISYVCLYSFIAPFWTLKSFYNVIFRKRLAWR